jgi:hypothetical protein
MIDERFSAQAFNRCGIDTDEARQLAKSLEKAVQEEMKNTLKPKLLEVISLLNELGHCLALVEDTEECTGYYDSRKLAEYHEHSLGVFVDLCASSGYSHLICLDEDDDFTSGADDL